MNKKFDWHDNEAQKKAFDFGYRLRLKVAYMCGYLVGTINGELRLFFARLKFMAKRLGS